MEEQQDLVGRYLEQAYWPWPVGLAYCQPADVRDSAVAAVVEILDLYPRIGSSDFATRCSLQRLFEMVTGETVPREPTTINPKGAEPWQVRSGEAVYWDHMTRLEQRLVGALHLGSLTAWGRAEPGKRLKPVDPTDWVGAEIDPDKTCDLVMAGWREQANDLGAILGETKRRALHYDIHLFGAAVRQFVEAMDRQAARLHEGQDSGDLRQFDDCLSRAQRPKEGYWTAWATLAWIASRNEEFTAATQLFEVEQYADRGEMYASTAWMALGNKAGEAWGRTFSDAEVDLREALEANRLTGGIAIDSEGKSIDVERREWVRWNRSFQRSGLVLIPGLHDFRWPSESVRNAFEPRTESAEMQVGGRSAAQWQQQRVSSQQALVFQFFDIATAHLPGGSRPLAKSELHVKYERWLGDRRGGGSAYRRTAFEKMLERFLDGWRIVDGRWHSSH